MIYDQLLSRTYQFPKCIMQLVQDVLKVVTFIIYGSVPVGVPVLIVEVHNSVPVKKTEHSMLHIS